MEEPLALSLQNLELKSFPLGYYIYQLQISQQSVIFKLLTMQIQKSIEIFLEKNNLTKTLQIFKNESKRNPIHYAPTRGSQLANIHKFTLSNTDAGQVREHLQKTDPNILKKVVKRLKKRNKNNNISQQKPQILDIAKMKFFNRLLQKQNQNILNELDDSIVVEARQFKSSVNPLQQSRQYQNEWEGENDIGFEVYECTGSELAHFSQQIGLHKNMQQNALKFVNFPEEYFEKHFQKISKISQNLNDRRKSRLPTRTIFKKQQNEEIYPLEYQGSTYDSYDLKIIYDREKTGYEQQKQLPIVINEVLAARYQVVAVLGQAQFSKAIQVIDLQNNKNYCIKVIQNGKEDGSKDNFDQSIDQIKLLRYISANCNTDEAHLLTLHDFFYHKEHLMLVTQLLKDNLYDAYKLHPKHFDPKAIKTYAKQILQGLQKMHSLHIIHTDLKPENILIKSYSKQELKIIDIGSSIFFHDKLSFYVQTRSYRAPQVILGCPYDQKIDIWSFGCIIAELFTGSVLFQSDSVGGLLAKMQGLRGPWPSWMIEKGKYSKKFFTNDIIPFEQLQIYEGKSKFSVNPSDSGNQVYRLYIPKFTNLKARINCQDKIFVDFLSKCLKLDPSVRLSAKQALKHPFLNQ